MQKFRAGTIIKKAAVISLSFLFLVFAAQVGAKPFFADYDGVREFYSENGSFTEGITREKDCNEKRTLRKITLRGKKGEGIFTSVKEAEKIIADFDAELVFAEELCGGENFYYYSKKLPFSASISGKTVNLQIYRRGESVKAGTPLIYGSF